MIGSRIISTALRNSSVLTTGVRSLAGATSTAFKDKDTDSDLSKDKKSDLWKSSTDSTKKQDSALDKNNDSSSSTSSQWKSQAEDKADSSSSSWKQGESDSTSSWKQAGSSWKQDKADDKSSNTSSWKQGGSWAKQNQDSRDTSSASQWNQNKPQQNCDSSSNQWKSGSSSFACSSPNQEMNQSGAAAKDKSGSFGSYAKSSASGNIDNQANEWKGRAADGQQQQWQQSSSRNQSNNDESAKLDQWQMEAVQGDRKWQERAPNRGPGFTGKDNQEYGRSYSDQSWRPSPKSDETRYGSGMSEERGYGTSGPYQGQQSGWGSQSSQRSNQQGWTNQGDNSSNQWDSNSRNYSGSYGTGQYGQDQYGQNQFEQYQYGQRQNNYPQHQEQQQSRGQNWPSYNSPSYGYTQNRGRYSQDDQLYSQSHRDRQQRTWPYQSYDVDDKSYAAGYLTPEGNVASLGRRQPPASEWDKALYHQDYQRGLYSGQRGSSYRGGQYRDQHDDRDDYAQSYGSSQQYSGAGQYGQFSPQRGEPQQGQYGAGYSFGGQYSSRLGDSSQYGGGLNYQSRRWSSPNLEQYGSSAGRDRADSEGYGGSATYGMRAGSSHTQDIQNKRSQYNPSEYQKWEESFGRQGSFGANWNQQPQSQQFSSQQRQENYNPSEQSRYNQYSQNQGSGEQGQFKENRASDWNQNQRGQPSNFERNLDNQSSQYQSQNQSQQYDAKSSSHENETLMEKVKDKMGDVKEKMGDAVEKVEDLASSAWNKISGSSKDKDSTEKK